ncbi:MAG TPA: radical SAM protein [Candidatus Bipolaricaulota bacterium]|nr:radical SAM protein [Candidatus Bipolaricaulota bacterium]
MRLLSRIKNSKNYLKYKKEFYKKAVVSYPPRHVSIGVMGGACSFQCAFCAYHCPDAAQISNVYKLPFTLSMEDFKKMVDMCYQSNVPHVHLTAGGEPFLCNDILKMIDYVIYVYGEVSLQTDFFKEIFEMKNYLDEILKRKKYISYITTDILSGDPAQHEQLKKGSDFKYLMDSMEYLSKNSKIKFKSHLIITKHNYLKLNDLIDEFAKRKINTMLEIVNLHPHGFNELTSKDSVYLSGDVEITEALSAAKAYGKEKGVKVLIPLPFDKKEGRCGSFWTRFQTWPVKGNDPKRYGENVIIGGCNAVVLGDLSSLGYMFDYDNIMDLWNNERFVKIRKDLMNGIYPDKECANCQSYKKTN